MCNLCLNRLHIHKNKFLPDTRGSSCLPQMPGLMPPYFDPLEQPWTIYRNATVVANDPTYLEQQAYVQQWEKFTR